MKIKLIKPELAIKAVNWIRDWTPNPDNDAKNPHDDVVWRMDKIREFLGKLKAECDGVKSLLDAKVTINPRPAVLPKITKIYDLLCADYKKHTFDLRNRVRFYKEVLDVYNCVNVMDGHIYAASQAEPSRLKHYESGIEKDTWKVVGDSYANLRPLFASLDKNNRTDYIDYYNRCLVKHPLLESPVIGEDTYSMLMYLGRAKTGNRPMFQVVRVKNTTGNLKKDLEQLPKNWVPIYVKFNTPKQNQIVIEDKKEEA